MVKIDAARVHVGKFYRTPPQTVWRLITDTRQWPIWGPTVKDVDCPVRFIYKGVSGRILSVVGIWLPFEITDYQPGRFWRWKIGAIGATGHRLQASAGGGGTLWFDMPLPAAPYALICHMALRRIAELLPNDVSLR